MRRFVYSHTSRINLILFKIRNLQDRIQQNILKKMKKNWIKFKNWIFDNPTNFFLVVFVVFTPVLLILDFKSQFLITGSTQQIYQDWRNVLTELHGL